MIGGIGMEEAANNINSFMEYYNSGEWIKNSKSKYEELCEQMRALQNNLDPEDAHGKDHRQRQQCEQPRAEAFETAAASREPPRGGAAQKHDRHGDQRVEEKTDSHRRHCTHGDSDLDPKRFVHLSFTSEFG